MAATRIKLRINPLDLDLLSLAQNPAFDFPSALKRALLEYVKTGKCLSIALPESQCPVTLKTEVFDITLNGEYAVIGDWIKTLHNGFRSAAVKTIFRRSLETPVLYAFNSEFGIKKEQENEQQNTPHQQPVPATERTDNSVNRPAAGPNDDLDIFDLVTQY